MDPDGFGSNARPIIEGGFSTATVQAGHRERLSDNIIWDAKVPVDIIGNCPLRTTGRYIRLRFEMPSGQHFNHLQGLDVTTHQGGTLR